MCEMMMMIDLLRKTDALDIYFPREASTAF